MQVYKVGPLRYGQWYLPVVVCVTVVYEFNKSIDTQDGLISIGYC